jgi:dTDP-4-amino-4,6-dideoxygalactose transaminase
VPSLTGEDHVFHLYVIRTSARDEMRAYLNQRGVGTGIHYPVPCHLQPPCASFDTEPGGLPVTEQLAGEILSLPMFPELRDEEIDYTVNVIREFFAQRSSKKR